MRSFLIACALAPACLLSAGAFAHVTLENQQAVAGSTYKAIFRVPHACGQSPTTAIRVQIPDGVTSVLPQPKPGWQLATVKAKLATPISDGHGGQITEGVREVVWSGGKLQHDHYDEFVMRAALPDKPNSTIYFPVVQDCEQGVNRWIEIPEAGKTSSDYKQPAPQLRLTPKP